MSEIRATGAMQETPHYGIAVIPAFEHYKTCIQPILT